MTLVAGSCGKKRAADSDSDVGGNHRKRQYPAATSPVTCGIDGIA
jgi:hypothetical protein